MMTSNTKTLEQAEKLTYHMLPQDGEQTVEISYCHADDGYLYCRSYDRSDLTLSITRCEIDEGGPTPFESWNGLLPETTGDEEELLPASLIEMIAAVSRHGDAFTGGVARDAAQGWLDADFDADSADEWMSAGWWDCDRAGSARDMGLTAEQTVVAAAILIEAVVEGEPHYTDGDPIYSICNGDTSIDVLMSPETDAA